MLALRPASWSAILSTPNIAVTPSAEDPDFDAMMKANLHLFGEADPTKRAEALEALWARDGMLVDPEGVSIGHEAISANIGALLKQIPPGTRFEAVGDAAGHHGLGRLRWRTVTNGAPGPVTGTDIAIITAGKITGLYVIFDPVP